MLSFGETPALRGASISVKRGEIVAVMGPSGSGKSTLLHCLAGILVPDSGEVYFDGQRLDTMREAERSRLRRDRFGFVFQFGQLVPELTAEENVALPLLLGGTHRDEALREARSWFERLDLEGMERHRTGEMSGGQSQRVALARGLVAHPDVLFADEPTGSLDSLNGELVMGLLTRAAREQGSTVILVTHEPRVAAYADREVIVRDGLVTSTGAVPTMIRLGLRLTLGSGREAAAACARHRGCGRPRRRSAAVRPGRRQRAACPDRPWCVARHLGADAPVDVGQLDRRPAVVAAQRRPVRQPGDRPRRRCRHGTERTDPAGDSATCPDRGSSTHRRPSRASSRPCRRASWATGSPGARSGPSALPPFRLRTR